MNLLLQTHGSEPSRLRRLQERIRRDQWNLCCKSLYWLLWIGQISPMRWKTTHRDHWIDLGRARQRKEELIYLMSCCRKVLLFRVALGMDESCGFGFEFFLILTFAPTLAIILSSLKEALNSTFIGDAKSQGIRGQRRQTASNYGGQNGAGRTRQRSQSHRYWIRWFGFVDR